MGQHLPRGKTADTTEEMLRSQSSEELLGQRQNVAMEFLWVQQAIISRKKVHSAFASAQVNFQTKLCTSPVQVNFQTKLCTSPVQVNFQAKQCTLSNTGELSVSS